MPSPGAISIFQCLGPAESAIELVGLDDASTLVALSKSAVGVHILDQVQDGSPHAEANAKD